MSPRGFIRRGTKIAPTTINTAAIARINAANLYLENPLRGVSGDIILDVSYSILALVYIIQFIIDIFQFTKLIGDRDGV